jgi:hypothetical protein
MCPTDGTSTSHALATNTHHKRGARHYNVHGLLHKPHTKFIVSWLLQTFRLSDNCSPVLKSQVYQEYIELCQKKNLVPIHNSGTTWRVRALFFFSHYLLFPPPPSPHLRPFWLREKEKHPICMRNIQAMHWLCIEKKKKRASASFERRRL